MTTPTPSPKKKHIVFDVVGTLISYTNFFSTLETHLGPHLQSYGIPSKLFGMLWLAETERESLILSSSTLPTNNPNPNPNPNPNNSNPTCKPTFQNLLQPLLPRLLSQTDIPTPLHPPSLAHTLTKTYLTDLNARVGAQECLTKLRTAGFEIWACTSASRERAQKYLEQSGLNSQIPEDRLITCEEISAKISAQISLDGGGGAGAQLKVTKPQREVYEYMLREKFPREAEEVWWAACHMWDVVAARGCGFKGAWCAEWEREAVREVFGEVEVMGEDLVEMAEGIIAAAGDVDL